MSDPSCIGYCTICREQTDAVHWHHTIPQALGGVDSLQIPLCADCHNILHAKALAVFSMINGKSKKIEKSFWRDPAVERNAEQFVIMIVEAMLNPPDSSRKTYKVVVEVDADLHNGLKLLKQDTPGVTSISGAIRFCIKQILTNKGLYHESEQQNPNSNSRTQNKNSLWSMQRLGKRQPR